MAGGNRKLEIIRILVIAVLAWFFIAGLRRGLIRQALEVIGIVVAFLAAFYFAHLLAVWIDSRISVDYRVSLTIAALAIFTGIVIFVHFVGLGLQKLFKLTIMGMFDHLAGGLFGALKGVLLVSMALSIIMVLPIPDAYKDEVKEDPVTGMIYPVLKDIFNLTMSHLPGGVEFEQIARIKESSTVKEVKKKLDNIKKDIDKSK
jgi:membrane protein required for colicin V production